MSKRDAETERGARAADAVERADHGGRVDDRRRRTPPRARRKPRHDPALYVGLYIRASSASPTVRTPTTRQSARARRSGASVAVGQRRTAETELRRLAHAQRRLRRRPHFAGQADLAEHHDVRRNRPVAQARRDRRDDRQVGRRLVDASCRRRRSRTHRRSRGSGPTRLSSTASSSDEPVLIEAARRPPRVAERRRADERLHLDEDRPRAFDRAQHRRAGHVRAAARRETAATDSAPARSPAPVISNTPSSLTAPNRFFTARTTRCA